MPSRRLETPPAEESLAVEDAPAAEPDEKQALRSALRELEAAEARVARNAQRVYDETRAKLVTDVLPVLDNLDRTLDAARGSADGSLLDGVEMVRAQLEQVILRYGAERIDAKGEHFDPAIHHALATSQVEPERVGLVIAEAEAGYRFGGKVLRPAKVVVGAR